MKKHLLNRPFIPANGVSAIMLATNVVIALLYFAWWFTLENVGNPVLYGLLFFGEVYHVSMVLLFWFTVRGLGHSAPEAPAWHRHPSLAVFITVAGEPVEIVQQTIQAIKATRYSAMKIYILNDSYVAKKPNWQEYETLAATVGVYCITRRVPGGAKAGNINHALRKTKSELVAIFDADMQPYEDFFKKTVPFFRDTKIGFVQTPQYYANHGDNEVTAAAWEQQEFFFGPIMRGKNSSNAAFICGTNVVIRRQAIEDAGGINEASIAEDFLTSILIHQAGWHSIYVPEVLAEGLAPQDLHSYYKQQLRWARGSLEVLFKYNPLLMRGLTWPQRLEYLSSTLYYCTGLIVVLNAIIPLIFLLTGLSPTYSSTTLFAFFFMPFMFSVIFSLHAISGSKLTFRAISFTYSSWYLQLIAFFSAAFGREMGFVVTPKHRQEGNFLFVVRPQLIYLGLALVAVIIGINREGISPSVITNVSWVAFTVLLSLPFVTAALPKVTIFKPAQSISHE